MIRHYLITVDYLSGFFQINRLSSTAVSDIIYCLKASRSTRGSDYRRRCEVCSFAHPLRFCSAAGPELDSPQRIRCWTHRRGVTPASTPTFCQGRHGAGCDISGSFCVSSWKRLQMSQPSGDRPAKSRSAAAVITHIAECFGAGPNAVLWMAINGLWSVQALILRPYV